MILEASDVRRLMQDSTFRAIIEKVKADQVSAFINSHSDESGVREEAHTILRALEKIEQAMNSVIAEESIQKKREKLK